MLPDMVPSYAVGPLIGLVVAGTLASLSLVGLVIYWRYRPLRSLVLLYLAQAAYFLGFTVYAYQSSEAATLWGYRCMLLALCWLPVTWIWVVGGLRERKPGPWSWAAFALAACFSAALLAVEHPALLGRPLLPAPYAGVYHPQSYILKPLIFIFDLSVVLIYIYMLWRRWWPGPKRPSYANAVLAGLVLWLLGGLHDAAHSLHLGWVLPQPVLWLASIWLSLCLFSAVALHLRDLERQLVLRRLDLEGMVAERTAELQREVSERRRAEQDLFQLAAGVAHNFNNVLMAVMSNTQAAYDTLVQRSGGGGKVAGLLENALQGSLAGKDVVRRLSHYVERRQKGADQGEVISLSHLMESLKRMVTGTWPQIGEGLMRLNLEPPPRAFVRGVWGELMEVFLNISKNAVEATGGRGELTISSRLEGDTVCIDFTDSGPGVSQEELDHFFAPFFTTKDGSGQGLGLAVSRGIIQAHGGGIIARSRPGLGTTVSVSLPLVQAPARHGAASQAGGRRPGRGGRVLLVEDESLVAMGVEALLKEAGHQVHTAGSLDEARAAIRAQQPEVIVSDLGLPDARGWEVLERLRRAADGTGGEPPPVIVLTGWGRGQLEPRPQAIAPPAALLQKPVEREPLLEALSMALAPSGERTS